MGRSGRRSSRTLGRRRQECAGWPALARQLNSEPAAHVDACTLAWLEFHGLRVDPDDLVKAAPQGVNAASYGSLHMADLALRAVTDSQVHPSALHHVDNAP